MTMVRGMVALCSGNYQDGGMICPHSTRPGFQTGGFSRRRPRSHPGFSVSNLSGSHRLRDAFGFLFGRYWIDGHRLDTEAVRTLEKVATPKLTRTV
jgi:hypothetical protein